jgi:hypothetical protein
MAAFQVVPLNLDDPIVSLDFDVAIVFLYFDVPVVPGLFLGLTC